MRKILYILIVLFLPATASAYSLLQRGASGISVYHVSYMLMPKEEPPGLPSELLVGQTTEHSVSENQLLNAKPVSPNKAFFLASIPLISSLIVFGIFSLPGDGYLIIPAIYTPISFSFLTIPYHNYVHDPASKTYMLSIIKALGIVPFTIGAATVIMAKSGGLWCDEDPKCDPHHISSEAWANLFVGATALIGIYLYELIDAPLAAGRYNEKIKQQQQGVNLIPYATRDRMGLACQVSF